MKAFVSEINELHESLFWFLNFLGVAILNNCDVNGCPYCSRTDAVCVKTINSTVIRHNYSRWWRKGNLKVKESDSQVHFFDTNTFFEENCSNKFDCKLNIISLGLKLFINRSEGSLQVSLYFSRMRWYSIKDEIDSVVIKRI